jgi:hypothetical protein
MRTWLVLWGVLTLSGAACSSESAPPGDSPDATSDDAAIASDGGIGDGGTLECYDQSGIYAITGTCTNMLMAMYPVACVRQGPGCAATMYGEEHALVGTASGTTMSVATDDPPAQSCEVDASGSTPAFSCSFPAYSATCTGTGTPLIIPDASETCCDVSAQDCADATARCQLVWGQNNSPVTACLPLVGGRAEGESCTRPDDMTALGRDDCAKGHLCVNWSQADQTQRVCRKLCRSDAECGPGLGCRHAAGSVPPTGLCVETCDLFNTPSGCPENNQCYVTFDVAWSNGNFVESAFCQVPHASKVT